MKTKRKGITLVEVIITMALIGIISIFTSSIISTSLRQFERISHIMEMNYIGEMIIEKLKTNTAHAKEVKETIDDLGQANYVDSSFDTEKYSATIYKDYGSERILEIRVKICHEFQEEEHIYVEFKGAVPK